MKLVEQPMQKHLFGFGYLGLLILAGHFFSLISHGVSPEAQPAGVNDPSINASARSGEDIIRMMHERYEGSWYPYLTFVQKTDFYEDGELSDSQTWYEALALPGRLVIKFDSLSSGTGVVFRKDTQYVFQNNRLVRKIPRIHDLLVLGFDVYGQPPSETISELEQNGFDLDLSYETQWQGRDVYVVGAGSAADSTHQFWVDREHLYFVRMLKTNPENGMVQETQFNNYRRAGGGWVAPEVLFFNNRQLVMEEQYSDISLPERLDDSIFDLDDFQGATW